jgi:hypothetical protein
MIHFSYLVGFGVLVSIAFAVFADGSARDRVLYGLKTFSQFFLISLAMAWAFYFLPW